MVTGQQQQQLQISSKLAALWPVWGNRSGGGEGVQPGVRRHCRGAASFQLLLWERLLVLNICAALFTLADTRVGWRVNRRFGEQERQGSHICVPPDSAARWSL